MMDASLGGTSMDPVMGPTSHDQGASASFSAPVPAATPIVGEMIDPHTGPIIDLAPSGASQASHASADLDALLFYMRLVTRPQSN